MKLYCWPISIRLIAKSRAPCSRRKLSAETSTTSPGVIVPTCHRWAAHSRVAAAIPTRATSFTTRIFSLYIQLEKWAWASAPKASDNRARSRSRAEKVFTATMLMITSISSPPASLERWA